MTHLRTLALCLLALGVAQAQDRVDTELDESLRRTYDQPARAPAEPVPDYAEREIEKERDEFQVTLRLHAGLQAAFLEDLEIAYREGGTGGDNVELLSSDRSWDIGEAFAGIPTVELNLGGYFAIRGSAWGTSWREDENSITTNTEAFQFGNTQFGLGETVESQFDMLTADIQLGAHVVTNRYVRLGLFGGARYVGWETTLERVAGGAYAKETSKIEAVVPTFTITFDVSPTPWLEFYVNGTAGWLGYESEDEQTVTINGAPTRVAERSRETTTLDAEAGIRLIFGGHFGIYAGYRVGFLEIEREVPERKEGVRSLTHGPVAGLLIQF